MRVVTARLHVVVVLAALTACARGAADAGCRRPAGADTGAAACRPPIALVRAGCLDCLIDAYRRVPVCSGRSRRAEDAATAGAIRSAALDRPAPARARDGGRGLPASARRALLLGAAPTCRRGCRHCSTSSTCCRPRSAASRRTPTSDLDLDADARSPRTNGAWRTRRCEILRRVDELAAYVWLAFACGSTESARRDARRDRRAGVDVPRHAAHRASSERSAAASSRSRCARCVERDPRFVETTYYLGAALRSGSDKLDEADQPFEDAYAWRPQWPALTQSIANVAMTVEEFETRGAVLRPRRWRSSRTRSTRCSARSRALTYLGQSVEAIATVDRLLGERWFVGDARYWRALNESELERQRRGVGRHRGGGQAADQRRGAEAGRPDRLPPAAAGRVAGEVRGIAHAQPERLRDRLLPRRRARASSASWTRDRRRAARGRPLPARAAERDTIQEIATIRASDGSAGAQGRQDRAARAVHRQGTPHDRDVVVRHRGRVLQPVAQGRKRGSSPRRWPTTSSSASARRRSWPGWAR